MSSAQLVITGLGEGSGRQKIVFSARVQVSPEYDLPSPNVRGAQIALDDLGTGASLYERSQFVGNPLPGGGAIPFSCHAWRGKNTKFSYREITHDCPSPVTNGRVRQVQIDDRRSRSPSEIVMKYKVSEATVPVPAGSIRSSFTFGSTAILSALGKCAEHTFLPSDCRVSGSKLKCR